jgi:hypothetical protein
LSNNGGSRIAAAAKGVGDFRAEHIKLTIGARSVKTADGSRGHRFVL